MHYEALKIANIEVIDGYFSRDYKINKKSRKAWGLNDECVNSLENLCDRYKSMDKSNLIAVVLTPTTNHYKDIDRLLNISIDIVCEKPLAITKEEIMKIKRKADKKGTIVRCTYNYGGYPMFREMTEQIRMNKIGKIQQLILQMPQEGLVRPPNISGQKKPPQKWRLKDPMRTSMANLDLGAHLYQLGRMITDEKIEIIASCMANFTDYDDLEDTTYAMIKTIKGTRGLLWLTKSMLGSRNGLEITVAGDKGTMNWKQTEPERINYSNAEILSQVLDRGSKCIEANKERYDRMKAGHPAGYIEAFANTYIDIQEEIIKWKEEGIDESKYGLDIEMSMEVAIFLEELKRGSIQ